MQISRPDPFPPDHHSTARRIVPVVLDVPPWAPCYTFLMENSFREGVRNSPGMASKVWDGGQSYDLRFGVVGGKGDGALAASPCGSPGAGLAVGQVPRNANRSPDPIGP